MADPAPTPEIHNAHGSYTADLMTLSDESGTVTLSICLTCHHIEAYCNHLRNTWDTKGQVLTCDLCGIDGT